MNNLHYIGNRSINTIMDFCYNGDTMRGSRPNFYVVSNAVILFILCLQIISFSFSFTLFFFFLNHLSFLFSFFHLYFFAEFLLHIFLHCVSFSFLHTLFIFCSNALIFFLFFCDNIIPSILSPFDRSFDQLIYYGLIWTTQFIHLTFIILSIYLSIYLSMFLYVCPYKSAPRSRLKSIVSWDERKPQKIFVILLMFIYLSLFTSIYLWRYHEKFMAWPRSNITNIQFISVYLCIYLACYY